MHKISMLPIQKSCWSTKIALSLKAHEPAFYHKNLVQLRIHTDQNENIQTEQKLLSQHSTKNDCWANHNIWSAHFSRIGLATQWQVVYQFRHALQLVKLQILYKQNHKQEIVFHKSTSTAVYAVHILLG
jgi:hypothetical protein